MCMSINTGKSVYNQITSSKNAIRKILGENIIVRRNYDPARFQGLGEIFGRNKKLFRTANIINNEIDRKSINYVGCFYNNQRELESIYIYNRKNKNIDVFTKSGELIRQYTPEEVTALFSYKHNSKNIHGVLRGTNKISDKKAKIAQKDIQLISNLFKEGKNVSKTTKELTTYRALDKKSLKEILSLKEGEIFTDPSFTSVATKKSKIFQFLNLRNFLHPVKIKLPEGTKYISLDELHNIVLANTRETELLLQEGNSFVITKKPKIGFIEMELVPKQTHV